LFDVIDRQDLNRSGAVNELVENNIIKKGKKIKEALDQELCRNIIARVADPAAFASGRKATPTNKWNAANGDPVADLKAAASAFFANCGQMPTHIFIPSLVLMHMGERVRAKYSVQTDTSERKIIESILLTSIGIPAENLVVPAAGAFGTTTFSQMWSDNVLLAYIKPEPIEEDLTFAVTFVPEDVPDYRQLPPYDAPHQTGIVIQGIREYKVEVIFPDAGYLIFDVLS
jgi:hypothetical protein